MKAAWRSIDWGIPTVLAAGILFAVVAQWDIRIFPEAVGTLPFPDSWLGRFCPLRILWGAYFLLYLTVLYAALRRFRWPAGIAAASALLAALIPATLFWPLSPFWPLAALLLLFIPVRWVRVPQVDEMEERAIRAIAVIGIFVAGCGWLFQIWRFRWNLHNEPIQCLAAAGCIAAALFAGILNRKHKYPGTIAAIILLAAALALAALRQNLSMATLFGSY